MYVEYVESEEVKGEFENMVLCVMRDQNGELSIASRYQDPGQVYLLLMVLMGMFENVKECAE